MVLGIIGVGQLAHYFVAGLRKAGNRDRIFLSPRNKEMADQLSTLHDCEILPDNQSVVDRADIVLLATRPEHSLLVLQDLDFRDGQVMLSAVAGVSLNDLQPLSSPAKAVRCLPLAPAEACAGGTPIYPDDERVTALLGDMVTVVPVDNETQFEIASVTGCIAGWVYQLIGKLQAWLVEKGIPEDQARKLAIETFHGATSLAKFKPDMDLIDQAYEIGREGTYTRAFMEDFEVQGGLKAFEKASDDLLLKLMK